MREGSYSTIRLGAYEPFKQLLGAHDPAHTPFYKKMVAGAISGSIGSAIATPTDLIKIRIQGDRSGSRYPSTLRVEAYSLDSQQQKISMRFLGFCGGV